VFAIRAGSRLPGTRAGSRATGEDTESGWGVGTGEYVRYTLVSGLWNVFVRLGLPVVALAAGHGQQVLTGAASPSPEARS
jgi:hypothetical protein